MSLYNPSIVEYFAEQRSNCGYCSSPGGSHSYGLDAHTLKVEDYQNMIDRGWRRCGKYCYRPILEKSCCSLYVIRCAATNFKLSKSQKKILKRFNNFLVNGTVGKEKIHKTTEITQPMHTPCLGDEKSKSDVELTHLGVDSCVDINIQPTDNQNSLTANKVKLNSTAGDEINKPEKIDSTSSKLSDQPRQKNSMKAKQIRIERKRQKLQKLGLSEEEICKKLIEKKKYPVIKTIEDYLNETVSKNTVHNLKISLVRSSPRSEEFIKTFQVAFDLYKLYQRTVHKDPPEKLTQKQYERFLVISPLQIKLVLVESPEFAESFNQSALLFAKYQKAVHHESDEDCGVGTYHSFLVNSPLKAVEEYGSYHAQYWLDDKLIAVGVIDILPKCVSSVYFFYDPDYAFLSLGTYGALREIELTRQLSLRFPNLVYYYMGFYIHSCVRMKYKGAFRPSYLSCPEARTWHLIQECLPKIEAVSKCLRFNEDPNARDTESDVLPSEVLILHDRKAMSLDYYMERYNCRTELRIIMEYAKLIGKKCAKSILLFQR